MTRSPALRDSRTDVHKIATWVLLAVLFLVVLWLPSCAGAGQAQIVGYATLQGNGDVRATPNYFLALGELKGEAGLFVEGSGFPLSAPLATAKDSWTAIERKTKKKMHGKLNVDPLPPWTESLYRPGEFLLIAAKLGFPEGLLVEGVATEPEPVTPTPTP